jgi:hypothetical protein
MSEGEVAKLLAEIAKLRQQMQFYLMVAHSYNECLAVFLNECKISHSPEEFGLPPLSDIQEGQLQLYWRKLQALKMPGDGTEHVHVYFDQVFELVANNATDVDRRLRSHKEVAVTFPNFRFDRVLSAAHIAKITYENVECLIEIKARVSKSKKRPAGSGQEEIIGRNHVLETDGQGQAVSYLSAVCCRAVQSPEKAAVFRVSIFFNGDVIRFFRFENSNSCQPFASELFAFSDDTPNSSPSQGFRWLFSYLAFMASKVQQDYVALADGTKYPIVSTFATGDIQVYMVSIHDQDAIVKKNAIPGKHSYSLGLERTAYDFLKEHTRMTLLDLDNKRSDVNCLVYTPIGVTLPEFVMNFQSAASGENLDSELLRRVVLEAAKQLEMMHEKEVCHADIPKP